MLPILTTPNPISMSKNLFLLINEIQVIPTLEAGSTDILHRLHCTNRLDSVLRLRGLTCSPWPSTVTELALCIFPRLDWLDRESFLSVDCLSWGQRSNSEVVRGALNEVSLQNLMKWSIGDVFCESYLSLCMLFMNRECRGRLEEETVCRFWNTCDAKRQFQSENTNKRICRH